MIEMSLCPFCKRPFRTKPNGEIDGAVIHYDKDGRVLVCGRDDCEPRA